MRPTWTAAAITAVLSLTAAGVATASLASATDLGAAHAHRTVAAPHASRLAAPHVSQPVAPNTAPGGTALAPNDCASNALPSNLVPPNLVPPVGVPAPDPVKNLAALGALGNVLELVNSILAKATPSSGAPDTGVLQKLVDELKAAITKLLGQLPAPPPLPAAPTGTTASDPGCARPHEPPTTRVPAVGVPPLSPADALAKVQKDVDALVKAATAAKPDPAAVKNGIPPLSVDSIAATAATATALTPAP